MVGILSSVKASVVVVGVSITSVFLKESIKSELYHCWNGIINGDWGGDALDWKEVFYHQVFKDGIIEQTKTCIEWYGNFKLKSKS